MKKFSDDNLMIRFMRGQRTTFGKVVLIKKTKESKLIIRKYYHNDDLELTIVKNENIIYVKKFKGKKFKNLKKLFKKLLNF